MIDTTHLEELRGLPLLRILRRIQLRALIADSLSVLRVLGVAPVLILAAHGQWMWAFIALVVTWGTDPLDGLAAKRWGSLKYFYPKLDMDGLADTAIAFSAALVPVVYYAAHDGWTTRTIVVGTLFVLTVISGTAMTMVMNKPATRFVRRLIGFNMLVMHGVVQILAVTMWFAFMAGGIWLAMITGGVIWVFASFFQDDKLKLWWDGRLA